MKYYLHFQKIKGSFLPFSLFLYHYNNYNRFSVYIRNAEKLKFGQYIGKKISLDLTKKRKKLVCNI